MTKILKVHALGDRSRTFYASSRRNSVENAVLICAVRPAVHTNPSRKRSFVRTVLSVALQTGGNIKAPANEDTLLLIMFVGLRELGNICCGNKLFLNKNRNIFYVPDTNFVSATNVSRGGNMETFVSATTCPRLPGP